MFGRIVRRIQSVDKDNNKDTRTSLVAQWLSIRLAGQVTQVLSLVGEPRPHVLQGS